MKILDSIIERYHTFLIPLQYDQLVNLSNFHGLKVVLLTPLLNFFQVEML
jgi:hypothetical protein